MYIKIEYNLILHSIKIKSYNGSHNKEMFIFLYKLFVSMIIASSSQIQKHKYKILVVSLFSLYIFSVTIGIWMMENILVFSQYSK